LERKRRSGEGRCTKNGISNVRLTMCFSFRLFFPSNFASQSSFFFPKMPWVLGWISLFFLKKNKKNSRTVPVVSKHLPRRIEGAKRRTERKQRMYNNSMYAFYPSFIHFGWFFFLFPRPVPLSVPSLSCLFPGKRGGRLSDILRENNQYQLRNLSGQEMTI